MLGSNDLGDEMKIETVMRIANLAKDNELGEEDIVPIVFKGGVLF